MSGTPGQSNQTPQIAPKWSPVALDLWAELSIGNIISNVNLRLRSKGESGDVQSKHFRECAEAEIRSRLSDWDSRSEEMMPEEKLNLAHAILTRLLKSEVEQIKWLDNSQYRGWHNIELLLAERIATYTYPSDKAREPLTYPEYLQDLATERLLKQVEQKNFVVLSRLENFIPSSKFFEPEIHAALKKSAEMPGFEDLIGNTALAPHGSSFPWDRLYRTISIQTQSGSMNCFVYNDGKGDTKFKLSDLVRKNLEEGLRLAVMSLDIMSARTAITVLESDPAYRFAASPIYAEMGEHLLNTAKSPSATNNRGFYAVFRSFNFAIMGGDFTLSRPYIESVEQGFRSLLNQHARIAVIAEQLECLPEKHRKHLGRDIEVATRIATLANEEMWNWKSLAANRNPAIDHSDRQQFLFALRRLVYQMDLSPDLLATSKEIVGELAERSSTIRSRDADKYRSPGQRIHLTPHPEVLELKNIHALERNACRFQSLPDALFAARHFLKESIIRTEGFDYNRIRARAHHVLGSHLDTLASEEKYVDKMVDAKIEIEQALRIRLACLPADDSEIAESFEALPRVEYSHSIQGSFFQKLLTTAQLLRQCSLAADIAPTQADQKHRIELLTELAKAYIELGELTGSSILTKERLTDLALEATSIIRHLEFEKALRNSIRISDTEIKT